MLFRQHHISGQKVQWFYVFLLGFFAGILIMNLGKERLLTDTGLLDEYSLYRMKYMNIDKNAFFLYVIKERTGTLLLMALLATTVLGLAAAYVYTIWLGFSVGMLMSAVSIRYGIKGIFLFAGSCIPQQLFYVPACILLLNWCYELCCSLYFPAKIYESTYGNRKQMLMKHVVKLLIIIGVVIIGVLAESYVNPDIVSNLLKVF